ncbi:MAG: glycosyltransferase [Vicinamibacterales bacterium]|jgi:GT2 family glycosyltransferase
MADPLSPSAGDLTVPITAIVTAFERVPQTLATLDRLRACRPAPAQVIVHVDGNRQQCAAAIRQADPSAEVIVSTGNVGPGGGRNRLVVAASHDIVASFDDDSYPVDPDYFARVQTVFNDFPDASIVTGHVYHTDEVVGADARTAEWLADFSGGGCAYRREHYLEAGGYVPLTTAYGMEEVDLALRLHARGRRVLRTPWLRVFHDTDRARHADPAVTAASVSNILLLTFLRYPLSLWGIGLLQCANRIQWLLRHGRRRGVWSGLVTAPAAALARRRQRQVLPARAVRSYLRLRRQHVAAAWR